MAEIACPARVDVGKRSAPENRPSQNRYDKNRPVLTVRGYLNGAMAAANESGESKGEFAAR
jgi:hypothetical protein